MKKTLFYVGLFASTLLASENNMQYLDESKMDYNDPRIFIGVDGSYNYQLTSDSLDKSLLGYSVYAGIPISDVELIVKKTIANSNNLELDTQNLTLNFPISGTGSRMVYLGILGGDAKVTYNSSTVSGHNLSETSSKGTFYGAHWGKRYKYSQNWFGRMEFEYLSYDIKTPKTTTGSLDINSNFSFIYGMEYRF